MIWDPSLLAQQALQRAAERAPKAKKAAENFTNKRNVHKAITVLEEVAETGQLSDEMVERMVPLLELVEANRSDDASGTDIQVAPGHFLTLVSDDGHTRVVRGPFGVGGGPSDSLSAAVCPVCGSPYFSGARCIACGAMGE